MRSYTYTHANRLTQVVSGTLTTEFVYNGAGDRVARTVDGVTTAYVLDPAAGLTQVLVESTGGQTTSYLYGHDLLAQYDSGTWAYHLNDGLGSVRHLADPAGQVVASYSFSPFGVPLGESGGEPYGYTGEWWDAEVELLYLRARYMQPTTGRFVSWDQLEGNELQPTTLHKYTYAKNNPLNYFDPTGFQTEPQGDNPYDPAWCNSWWYPKKVSCQFITNSRVPERLRWNEMYANYTIIMAAQEAMGYKVGGRLWRNFLLSGGDLSLQGSWLLSWFREDPNFFKWHSQQMSDFLRIAVLPAAEESCNTKTDVEWKVRRGSPKTGNPEAIELSKDMGRYSLIPIAALRASEVSFTLGKYWLEGDFKAENIQRVGDWVIANVTIKRFVNDTFDFEGDFGGIPFHRLFPGFPNLGFGDVPNVWAQTLVQHNLAHYFDIHIEWLETHYTVYQPHQ